MSALLTCSRSYTSCLSFLRHLRSTRPLLILEALHLAGQLYILLVQDLLHSIILVYDLISLGCDFFQVFPLRLELSFHVLLVLLGNSRENPKITPCLPLKLPAFIIIIIWLNTCRYNRQHCCDSWWNSTSLDLLGVLGPRSAWILGRRRLLHHLGNFVHLWFLVFYIILSLWFLITQWNPSLLNIRLT